MTVSHEIYDPSSPPEWLDPLRAEVEELKTILPATVQFPPQCFLDMEAVFVRYVSRRAVTIRLPARDRYCNPMGTMQGGYIGAAIDNALGPLSYFAARKPCMTLDLHVQFIRPVRPGDTLTVDAHVVVRGGATMVLVAEVSNSRQKAVARGTANAVVLSIA